MANPMAMMQITQAFQPKVDQPGQVVGQPNPAQYQQQVQNAGTGLFSALEQGPQPVAGFANPNLDPSLFGANQDLQQKARAYQDAATPVTTGLGRLGVLEGIARQFTSKDERDAYRQALDTAQQSSFAAQHAASRKMAQDIFQMALPIVGRDQAQAMADRAMVDKTFGTQVQKALLDETRTLAEETREDDRTRAQESERVAALVAMGLPPEQARVIGLNEDLNPQDVMKVVWDRQQFLKEQEEKKWDMAVGMNVQRAEMRNSVRQVERSLAKVSPWSAGFASYLEAVRGTDAFDLANMLNTQQATVAFERLQAMRTDPRNETGGALGNVSNREVELLYSSYAGLHQGMSADELRTSLTDIAMGYDLALYSMDNEQKYFEAVKAGKIDEEQAAAMLEKEAYDWANQRMIHRTAESNGFSPKIQEQALQAVLAGEDTLSNFEKTFGWRPAVAEDRAMRQGWSN